MQIRLSSKMFRHGRLLGLSATALVLLTSFAAPASAATPQGSSTPKTACTTNGQTSSCTSPTVYKKWAHKTWSGNVGTNSTNGQINPDGDWACSLYVSDVGFDGTDLTSETALTCTGNITYMETHQQYTRSSYRGMLGYSAFSHGDPVNPPADDLDWSVGCDSGGGIYDYAQIAYPETNQLNNSSDVVGSENNLDNLNCGPNAPE